VREREREKENVIKNAKHNNIEELILFTVLIIVAIKKFCAEIVCVFIRN